MCFPVIFFEGDQCYLSTPGDPGPPGTSSEAAGPGGCPEAAQEGL